MKVLLKITAFLMFILLWACNQKSAEKNIDKSFSDSLTNDSNISDMPGHDQQIWEFSEMGDTIIKTRDVKRESLNAQQLIELLNSKYGPSVSLEFDKISNDTLYVRIPDSKVLTQQMGSHGAYDYMITSTFTLTELKDIHFVNFIFEWGDHAGPGVYTRQYFLDELSQIQR